MLSSLRSVIRAFARSRSADLAKPFVFNPKSYLTNALKDDLNLEIKNYKTDLPLFEYLQREKYEITDSNTSSLMKITKIKENTKIIIAFQADNGFRLKNKEQKEKFPVDSLDDSELEEEIESRVFEFYVAVMNTNTKQSTLFNCVAHRMDFRVENVGFFDNVEAEELGKCDNVYQGPNFSSLDEDLQKGLLEYLGGVGINDELIAFIATITVDKRRRLMIYWMKKIHEMLL